MDLRPAAATGLPLAVRGLGVAVREAAGARDILALPELTLAPGDFLVLTGPSGSGKSTLLHALSGLVAPSRGTVAWGASDLAGLGEGARDAWRRRHAGFVFQDFHLIEELSPQDNVLVPAWFGGRAGGALRARAAALLQRFQVPERPRATLLSRGEQQRTALARALLMEPAVIFADEPTASLDAATGAAVIAALAGLAREGRTVIAASHDPSLVAAATRRLALDQGRPVAQEGGVA